MESIKIVLNPFCDTVMYLSCKINFGISSLDVAVIKSFCWKTQMHFVCLFTVRYVKIIIFASFNVCISCWFFLIIPRLTVGQTPPLSRSKNLSILDNFWLCCLFNFPSRNSSKPGDVIALPLINRVYYMAHQYSDWMDEENSLDLSQSMW